MKFIIVAIRDTLTGRFMQPIFVENEGTARRWFRHVITTTDIFKDNPADFELCSLGEFEDTTGIYGDGTVNRICLGSEVIHERDNETL